MAPKMRNNRRVVSKVDIASPAFQKRFTLAQRKWVKKLQPLMDGARKSEQITEKDLEIVITV
jgi:hypothetical protein